MSVQDIEIKPRFSISQVNALTGIPKSTIRFWENQFEDYLNPYRTMGNQRRYADSEVEFLKRINHLIKVEGLTLEGAKKRLEAEGWEPPKIR